MTTFAERLKSERERLGLSQDDLAKLVDKKKKQSFISNFETEARKGTAWIVEIAHALGVDAYWLKTGKGNRTPSGTSLNEEQTILIKGFNLFGDELKNNWLETAKRAIDKADEAKKALELHHAAKKKAA